MYQKWHEKIQIAAGALTALCVNLAFSHDLADFSMKLNFHSVLLHTQCCVYYIVHPPKCWIQRDLCTTVVYPVPVPRQFTMASGF